MAKIELSRMIGYGTVTVKVRIPDNDYYNGIRMDELLKPVLKRDNLDLVLRIKNLPISKVEMDGRVFVIGIVRDKVFSYDSSLDGAFGKVRNVVTEFLDTLVDLRLQARAVEMYKREE